METGEAQLEYSEAQTSSQSKFTTIERVVCILCYVQKDVYNTQHTISAELFFSSNYERAQSLLPALSVAILPTSMSACLLACLSFSHVACLPVCHRVHQSN
jgi:hypothetical protein